MIPLKCGQRMQGIGTVLPAFRLTRQLFGRSRSAPGGSRLISGSADCSLGIFKCYTNKEKKSLFPDAERGRYVQSTNGSRVVLLSLTIFSFSNGLWKCVGKLPKLIQQPFIQ